MTTGSSPIACTTIPSPIGDIVLTGDRDGLTGVYMGSPPRGIDARWRIDAAEFQAAAEQLTAYFAGELREFTVPLRPEGTPFQLAVWEQLRAIPYGQTRSYGELAQRLGSPGASRAVGAANGSNPLSIVVPCHRVIGANGKLTGFGGGLPRKQWLLSMEQGQSQMPLYA
jgi:methylated-DNA-[protein]-cysteine S-methyltransferase